MANDKLFTGTSEHLEDELDAIIEEDGGSWNARSEEDASIQLNMF